MYLCLIFIYLILIILMLLFFPKIIQDILTYKKIKRLNISYEETKGNVRSLGCNVSLSGKVRVGKGVMASFILYEREQYNIELATNKMQEIKDYLYYINFDDVNLIINDFEIKYGILFRDIDIIVGKIFVKLKIKNGIFNNYIQNYTISDLIKSYVIAYYVIYVREYNVLSYTAQYSFVKNEFARLLTDDTFNLKEVKDTGIFYFEPYQLAFSDEKSITKGNILSTNLEEKNKGGKEFSALVGNAFEETFFNLTAKQISKDEISTERRLKTDNIFLKNKGEIINPYYAYHKYVDKWLLKIESKYMKIYSKKSVNFEFRKTYISFNSWIKDIKNCDYYKECTEVKLIKKYLTTLGYIKQSVRNYYDEDKIGSNNEDDFTTMEFVMPIKYTWGASETHEFKIMIDELYKYSKTNSRVLPKNTFFKDDELRKVFLKFLTENKNTKEVKKENTNNKNKKSVFVNDIF